MSSIAGGGSATRAPATPVASKADSAAVTTWPRPHCLPAAVLRGCSGRLDTGEGWTRALGIRLGRRPLLLASLSILLSDLTGTQVRRHRGYNNRKGFYSSLLTPESQAGCLTKNVSMLPLPVKRGDQKSPGLHLMEPDGSGRWSAALTSARMGGKVNVRIP